MEAGKMRKMLMPRGLVMSYILMILKLMIGEKEKILNISFCLFW
jgi:hypothetical protein